MKSGRLKKFRLIKTTGYKSVKVKIFHEMTFRSGLNYGNLKLLPKLRWQLKPGARILTRDYTFGDWMPHKTVVAPMGLQSSFLYLWRL